jgi:hypothetical protein
MFQGGDRLLQGPCGGFDSPSVHSSLSVSAHGSRGGAGLSLAPGWDDQGWLAI